MNKQDLLIDTLDRRVQRRNERRAFFTQMGGAGVALAGASLLASCGSSNNGSTTSATTTPTAATTNVPTDVDILNFALNLEYLEAQFYSYATTGAGLASTLLTGTGTQGAVTATGAAQVPFSDAIVGQYAREIAADERAHVAFLRTALGTAAVAQPAIDISVSTTSAFSAAARSAGLITATQSFNPYSTDENFLLGAFIFEDVGVSAYKGASPLITNKTYLEAAAGILAAEAYHAGLVRTILARKGMQTPSAMLVQATEAISNARDSLDGASDIDQGIAATNVAITSSAGTTTASASNIVPTDANGLAYSRSSGQVLNIVYLTPFALKGGFFPLGVNGNLNVGAQV